MLTVYVGHDAREQDAYGVCAASLRRFEPSVHVQPVSRQLLGALYRRPTERRADGILWDVISDAPMATDFSLARFWVPYLQRTGWAVFCDCDFLWRAPVSRLLAYADPRYAVMVVKHEQPVGDAMKMDGQVQIAYARKNWSSLMLLNCDRINAHAPQVRFLDFINTARGLTLHQFGWVPEAQIGALPEEWNWLEGVSAPMDNPAAVHYTRGIPSMKGYEASAFANEWRSYVPARG